MIAPLCVSFTPEKPKEIKTKFAYVAPDSVAVIDMTTMTKIEFRK